jgi:hypothetical protein
MNWIDFVKDFAKKNDLSYSEALKKAGPAYKKQRGSTAKTTAKSTTKKGNVRKTAKGGAGSRLAYDDTKQEKEKDMKDMKKKRGRGRPKKTDK